MVSEQHLEAWEHLANEATEGPWFIDDRILKKEMWVVTGDVENEVPPIAVVTNKMDKFFIAAARDAVPALIARVRELEAECEMLAELMPDCPVKYGASVWCRRACPVWGRHDDDGPDYYCTTAERREYARKEIERDEEYRERTKQS